MRCLRPTPAPTEGIVTSREDFGEPMGSDLLLDIGLRYLLRGLLINAVRALISGAPPGVAEDVLRTVLIETRRQRDGN